MNLSAFEGSFEYVPPISMVKEKNGTLHDEVATRVATVAAKLPFVWASTVVEGAQLAEILEGVLTEAALSVCYGASNSGKTYVILDLACSVARGTTWLGCRTVPGAVVYIAAEGGRTIQNRILAYKTHTGATSFPLGIIASSVNLLDPAADTLSLIELIRIRSKEIGQPVRLVVVDTLARVMAGGDENNGVDVGAVVHNCDRIRQATGAHLLLIHHSGKDQARGARGWSGLQAALDTEIEVTHEQATGIRNVRITKQRDLASTGATFAATLRPLPIGTNQWGNPITACVVEAVDSIGSSAPAKTKQLPRASVVALDSLRRAMSEVGEVHATAAIPYGTRVVTLDQWRNRYNQRVPLDVIEQSNQAERTKATEARKKQFQRERKALQDAGFVDSFNELWWSK